MITYGREARGNGEPDRPAAQVYVAGEAVNGSLVQAAVVPTADPIVALVVELYATGTIRTAWGEATMSGKLYLSAGMRRDDGAAIPEAMRAEIGRRYPEHVAWVEEPAAGPGPR